MDGHLLKSDSSSLWTVNRKRGTGKIIEYFGEGCESISAGKIDHYQYGSGIRATTSLFPFDGRMADFLRATERGDIATLAEEYASLLKADEEISENPSAYYDEVIEIDLSTLKPAVNGPHTPDARHELSNMKNELPALDLPEKFLLVLLEAVPILLMKILDDVALVKMASEKGLRLQSPLMISPGSNRIAETMKRDGFSIFLKKQAQQFSVIRVDRVLGNGIAVTFKKERRMIVTSFNRNFKNETMETKKPTLCSESRNCDGACICGTRYV